MPARVRAHYARTLLAWTSAALLKLCGGGGAAPGEQRMGGGPASAGDVPGRRAGALHEYGRRGLGSGSGLAAAPAEEASGGPASGGRAGARACRTALSAASPGTAPGPGAGAGAELAVRARLWSILAALLASPDIPADGSANPALFGAAARTCRLMGQGSEQGAGSAPQCGAADDAREAEADAAAAALLRVLRVLGAKFGRTCRPSLEHRLVLMAPAHPFSYVQPGSAGLLYTYLPPIPVCEAAPE